MNELYKKGHIIDIIKYKKVWECLCDKPKFYTKPALMSINKNRKKRKKKVQIVEPEKDPDALTLECSSLSTVLENNDHVPGNPLVDFGTSDNNEV